MYPVNFPHFIGYFAERRGFNCKPTCSYVHPQTKTFLYPDNYVPYTKDFGNRYQPFHMGICLEGYYYKFHFLQFDADIVPCGSGSAPQL